MSHSARLMFRYHRARPGRRWSGRGSGLRCARGFLGDHHLDHVRERLDACLVLLLGCFGPRTQVVDLARPVVDLLARLADLVGDHSHLGTRRRECLRPVVDLRLEVLQSRRQDFALVARICQALREFSSLSAGRLLVDDGSQLRRKILIRRRERNSWIGQNRSLAVRRNRCLAVRQSGCLAIRTGRGRRRRRTVRHPGLLEAAANQEQGR